MSMIYNATNNQTEYPRPVVLHIAPKNKGEERKKAYLQVTILPKKKQIQTFNEHHPTTPEVTTVSTFQLLYQHQQQAQTCRRTNFVNPEGIIFSLGTAGVDYNNGVFDISFPDAGGVPAGQILADSEKVDMEVSPHVKRWDNSS